ncbi:hypothetical protein AAFF_G00076270, partial [Aldrovandia affinis]
QSAFVICSLTHEPRVGFVLLEKFRSSRVYSARSRRVQAACKKSNFDFSCLGGTDSTKHLNEVDLFGAIDQKGQVCCGIQTIAPSHNKRYD